MKLSLFILVGFCLGTSLSSSAFASPDCNFKAQQAAQKIAQLNGLSGNKIESAYGTNLFLVTVDSSQDYVVYATDADKTCQLDQILFHPTAPASAQVSVAACNMKAQSAAQAIAQFNGLSGNNVSSSYSTTDLFTVTVDGSQTFSLRVSNDGACLIEKIALNH